MSETRHAAVSQTWILRGLFSPKSPGENNEEDKEMTPRISHHLNAGGAGTSITEFDA